MNQQYSWDQVILSTTAFSIVEKMKEMEICNSRIALNTAWNTLVSVPLVQQAGSSNWGTAAVATRFQILPTKWDTAKHNSICLCSPKRHSLQ